MNGYEKAKSRQQIREQEAIAHEYGSCLAVNKDFVDEECRDGMCGYEPIFYRQCGLMYRHRAHKLIHLKEVNNNG